MKKIFETQGVYRFSLYYGIFSCFIDHPTMRINCGSAYLYRCSRYANPFELNRMMFFASFLSEVIAIVAGNRFWCGSISRECAERIWFLFSWLSFDLMFLCSLNCQICWNWWHGWIELIWGCGCFVESFMWNTDIVLSIRILSSPFLKSLFRFPSSVLKNK